MPAESPRERCRDWPDAPAPDHVTEAARKLALNLRSHLASGGPGQDSISLRAAETATGVHHTVIGKILHGQTWATLATIVRLEYGLDADLWPAHVDSTSG